MDALRAFACIAAIAVSFSGCSRDAAGKPQVVVSICVEKDAGDAAVSVAGSLDPSELTKSTMEAHGGRKFVGFEMTAPGKRLKVLASIDEPGKRVEVIIDSTVSFRLQRALVRSDCGHHDDKAATDEIPPGTRTIYFSLGGK
jgi:hypothetical protein